jgi:hypothetical protein
MIVTAMIMAIQRLRAMTQGGGKAGKLARWTIGYYVLTTILAVAHSCLLVGLAWSKLMQPVSGDQLAVDEDDQETIDERKDIAIHEVVVDMFNSLVPQNIVNALATDSLLAVLVTAVVIGYVIKPGGALMRAVEEVHSYLPGANWCLPSHHAQPLATRYRRDRYEPGYPYWRHSLWDVHTSLHPHSHHLFLLHQAKPIHPLAKVFSCVGDGLGYRVVCRDPSSNDPMRP